MAPDTLTRAVKDQTLHLGFSQVGVCAAAEAPGYQRLCEWLARGYAGEMHYLRQRQEAYRHPDSVLPGARSLVMLTTDYRTLPPRPARQGSGRISRYAWGAADYHDLIHARLKQLARFLERQQPGCRARGVVDTAPLMERDYAMLAGLGWIGKHTLLLNQGGSWFFLAALLTDAELVPDRPWETDHCGSCRACLDACPTQAFPQPYVLDARRCISYLTIEHRGPTTDPELLEGVGEWLLGCDICQEVCPWNRRAPTTTEGAFAPRADQNPMELLPLFDLDDAAFRARFRKTPLWRPRRSGLLRNAAIVLGNQRATAACDVLLRATGDREAVVRWAAGWALEQLAQPQAATGYVPQFAGARRQLVVAQLTTRTAAESELWVAEQLRRAQQRWGALAQP